MARCVWALVDEEITEHMVMNTCPMAKQWLFAMHDALDHSKFTKLLVTLWAVWPASRKAIHEGVFQSPISTYDFVLRYLSELGEASRHPREDLNVDGAVARNEDHGSISAIARDATGLFLGASTRTINDISHPATLEAMACAEALSLAEGLGITHIQVVSDCLEVIKALMGKNLSSYSSILFEISERCKLFQFVSFQHEGRESNGEMPMY
jgi:hypothetical protein